MNHRRSATDKKGAERTTIPAMCATSSGLYRMSRGECASFGRMFLKLKYTDITQNTYIQSWTVTEIMAREVWKYDSCYTLID